MSDKKITPTEVVEQKALTPEELAEFEKEATGVTTEEFEEEEGK